MTACGLPTERPYMQNEATETAIAAAAQKVSFGGGTAAVFGGLTANDIAIFVGATVAILGLVVQWYYKRKADRREIEADRRATELHAAQLQALRDEANEYGADRP
jgi:uncharacterized membrane protein